MAKMRMNALTSDHIHASCVLVGDAAVLLRGPSGSGKSSLALALVAQAQAQKRFAMLVGDDRISVMARGGRIIARCLPAIAGLVERRGLGLVPVAHEPAGMVRLVVDCGGPEFQQERMPEPEALITQILGVTLPRLSVQGSTQDAGLVLAALGLFVA